MDEKRQLDPELVITEIGRAIKQCEAEGRSEWIGIETVVRNVVAPAYERAGAVAIARLVEVKHEYPIVARALVELGSYRRLNVSVLSFFSEGELIDANLEFLNSSGWKKSGSDSEWAWIALSSYHMSVEDLRRIVFELIERTPWNDDILWMIGDGPLSDLEDHYEEIPGGLEELETLENTNPKLARIKKLITEWQ